MNIFDINNVELSKLDMELEYTLIEFGTSKLLLVV